MTAPTKAKVLFLSVYNSARSQMAEALLRKYGGNYFEAYSAGVEPGEVNPLAVQVMQELDCDISQQRAKSAQEYLGFVNFGYLIIVSQEAEANSPTTFLGVSNHLHWQFENPSKFEGSDEAKLGKFRQVRDQIKARILEWLSEQNIPHAGEAVAASAH